MPFTDNRLDMKARFLRHTIWSYTAPTGDTSATIEADGYFNDALRSGDDKPNRGDLILIKFSGVDQPIGYFVVDARNNAVQIRATNPRLGDKGLVPVVVSLMTAIKAKQAVEMLDESGVIPAMPTEDRAIYASILSELRDVTAGL